MVGLLPVGDFFKAHVEPNNSGHGHRLYLMLTKSKVPVTVEKPRATRSLKAKLALTLLCVSLSAIATVPFFFMGKYPEGKSGPIFRMPTTHDMHLHREQMNSFYNGLRSGEIYPRWEEDTNRGYGAPTTSYYPPGVYYLTSFCYLILRDWLRALLGTHLILMIASAAAIYAYARQVMSRRGAAVAMAAYIFLPYHLIDQYQRGALAELTGFVWMPLMLLFGERLFRDFRNVAPEEEDHLETTEKDMESYGSARPGSRSLSDRLLNASGLAVSYSAFVWSHPPTAYQFTLTFAIFVLLFFLVRRDWKGLLYLGGAMAVGLALSAYYLYPAAIEQNLIRHEYIAQSWPYHDSYVFVYSEPYATIHRGFFALIDGTWTFNAVLIVVAAGAILLKSKSVSLSLRQHALVWLVLGCFASFMMTKYSYPLGRFIPEIEIGVFSWRMLAITTLMLALLAGALMQAALNARRQVRRAARIAFTSLSLFITIGSVIFSAAAVAAPMATMPAFVRSLEHWNVATIPSTAPENIEDLTRGDQAELTSGNGRVSIDRWDPEHRHLSVELIAPDQLHIRTFKFPGWTANIDGHPADILMGQQSGEIVLDLEAGTHQITLDFLDTPPRREARWVTISAFLFLMCVVILSFARRETKIERERTTI